MERLPIEIQELIYEKAHRLMFANCLHDIQNLTFHKKQKENIIKAVEVLDGLWGKMYNKLMHFYLENYDIINIPQKQNVNALMQIYIADYKREIKPILDKHKRFCKFIGDHELFDNWWDYSHDVLYKFLRMLFI